MAQARRDVYGSCFTVISGSRQTVSSRRSARYLHLAVVATMAPSDMSGVFQRSEINFDGYWGKPTSTIDWCEANYEVSFYIAEFCKCLQCQGAVFVHFHFGLLDWRRAPRVLSIFSLSDTVTGQRLLFAARRWRYYAVLIATNVFIRDYEYMKI